MSTTPTPPSQDELDAGFLWDMREAAREVLDFTSGMAEDDFSSNKVVRYATERQLAVVGEAARQVSIQFRRAHPAIEWDALISRRNLLIHEYGEITAQRLWRVITKDLPGLIATLTSLIPNPPTATGD